MGSEDFSGCASGKSCNDAPDFIQDELSSRFAVRTTWTCRPKTALMDDHPEPSPPANPSAPESNSPQPDQTSSEPAREPLPMPWLTYAICAVCVLIFGYFNLESKSPSFDQVAEFLAPRPVSIWFGAYWGLITPAFVHLAFWHLFFNLWWAKDFGQLLELTLGRLKYLGFVLGSAAVSHGTELAISGQTGIGYSGVVYALFGYAWARRRVEPLYETVTDGKTVQWLLGWAVLCVVLTAAKIWNVANAAHIGGLVFGYCVGAVRIAPRFRGAYAVGLAGVTVLAILSATYLPWSQSWKDRSTIHGFVVLIDKAKSGDATAQFQYGHVLLGFPDRKREGLDWLKKSAEQNFVPAMNGLAWYFATTTNATLRNGGEALKWAKAACDKDGWNEASLVDTLAAAHAELDQWAEAVTNQQKAIALLTAKQRLNTNLWQGFQSRLSRYQNHEKFRE